MDKVTPRTLSGFMELLPAKQARLEKMQELLRRTYSLYGFAALDTPAIEAAEVLLAKGGGETEKQIYRFQKGDSDLALRFDLTVPLAKFVAANYAELNFPFRRYQIGKVWRGERAQRGRFREFIQADIDIIGDGKLSVVNEAEIPAIIYRSFSALGLDDFTIRINNRKILNGYFELMGLRENAGDIMRSIDKLDKVGIDKVRAILMDDCGVDQWKADELLRFIGFKGETRDKLIFLQNYKGYNDVFDKGLEELSAVVRLLPAFGVAADNYDVDLTIARGLDYYTGTVYETIMNTHPEIGSICSGGRYDNLAEYYTDKPLPGVGISIGLTRLFYVLDEQGLLSEDFVSSPADAVVIPMTDALEHAAEVATMLRDVGIRTLLYTEDKKFKQKLSYASKLGAPFVVIIGEDELRDGTVSVKNMETGEQVTRTAQLAAMDIRAAIRRRGEIHIIK